MKLADLPNEYFATDLEETWECERTPTPVRAFAGQLHATGCSKLERQERFSSYLASNAHTKLFGIDASAG
jgi:hypothetical protein